MPTVRFTAPTHVVNCQTADDNPVVVEDPETLRSLDGLQHDEVFSDYMHGREVAALAGVGITGGILRCSYDPEEEKLYYVTEYSVPRLLTADEIAVLMEYTIGQWSDGIGSNFFQSRLLVGPAPQLELSVTNLVKVEQFGEQPPTSVAPSKRLH